jgi:dTDP-4-amino-4,6-dideoxygalactose transaminase
VKSIAMGEGGAVLTNDSALAERVRRLRNHGIERGGKALENPDLALDANGDANPWYYEIVEPGYNYRASDIHCALGLSQLAKLDRFVERRRQLADLYDERLRSLAPLVRPIRRVPRCRPGWHLYIVSIDFAEAGMGRAAVMRRLQQNGVGSQVHYVPVHLQPYYRNRYGAQRLPGAETYYGRALSLPLFPAMADGDVDRVVTSLEAALSRA